MCNRWIFFFAQKRGCRVWPFPRPNHGQIERFNRLEKCIANNRRAVKSDAVGKREGEQKERRRRLLPTFLALHYYGRRLVCVQLEAGG